MGITKNKVRVAYYRVLYEVGDKRLQAYFWRWYNTHKVKSKDKAARLVLIRYYSTTPAPNRVIKALTYKAVCKVCQYKIDYSNLCDLLEKL